MAARICTHATNGKWKMKNKNAACEVETITIMNFPFHYIWQQVYIYIVWGWALGETIMGLKATTFIRHGIVSATLRLLAPQQKYLQYALNDTCKYNITSSVNRCTAGEIVCVGLPFKRGGGKHFNYYERKLRWRFYWNENCRCNLAAACAWMLDCSMFNTYIISAFAFVSLRTYIHYNYVHIETCECAYN